MPVLTITGENDFARSLELRNRLKAFEAAEGDLAIERLDGEEADIDRIQEALTSLPFLAEHKMVILKNPSKNKAFAERAGELLESVPDTTTLLLYEAKFDKRSGLYKLLKKQTEFKEFSAQEGAALAKWASEQATQQGARISSGEARYLIERVGGSQQLLASEIEKLSVLGGTIDRARIDALTEAAPQSTIFQLIDAAMAGRVQQALALYDEQRVMKVEPQQIIAMFGWQLHIMALVKTAGPRSPEQIAKEAKISPYVASKTQSLVRHMTLDRLRYIVDELLQIDVRSKREALDLDDALKYFVLTLGERV